MKNLLPFLFLFAAAAFGQNSYNISLFGTIDHYTGGANGADYSEIWGWTDTTDNREYAIIGTSQGTSIIDITELPLKEASFHYGPPSGYNYHEFRTYKNFLFIGAEGTNSEKRPGIQIVDLSTLPDSGTFKKTYTWIDTTNFSTNSTKLYNRAHTVSIEKNFLYVNGGDFGGTRIMDITDPLNPLQVGSYGKGSTPYVHDSYIRNDTLYAAAINAGRLDIVDMTAKGHFTQDTPGKVISKTPTVPEARTHQVWLSEDGNFMFVATEVTGGHLHIYNISDRTSPVEIAAWKSDPAKSIHNVFVKGDFLYVAYYGDGLRILDIKNPYNPIEVAFYDTYPGPLQFPHHSVFHGAWGVYPYFPSGKIAVSDMNTGLYVFNVDLKHGGNVVGIIRDASTQTPLSGTTVRILETGRSQVTTATGIYRYGNAAGLHNVVFSKTGYVADTLSITTPEGTTDTVYVNLVQENASSVNDRTELPTSFVLRQNFPNPFNPRTVISYSIPAPASVTLSVFNTLGQKIRTLVNTVQRSGEHYIEFDASALTSGVYYYTLTVGNYSAARKMIVTK
ncbi:MAG: choice-of-anchor B family protein [Bacteroidota bacterium]